jgi:hypothetical protein
MYGHGFDASQGQFFFAKKTLTRKVQPSGGTRSIFAKRIWSGPSRQRLSCFRAGVVAHCAKKGGAGRLGKAQPVVEPELWPTMQKR